MTTVTVAAERRNHRPPLAHILEVLRQERIDREAEEQAQDNDDAQEVADYLRSHGRGVQQ